MSRIMILDDPSPPTVYKLCFRSIVQRFLLASAPPTPIVLIPPGKEKKKSSQSSTIELKTYPPYPRLRLAQSGFSERWKHLQWVSTAPFFMINIRNFLFLPFHLLTEDILQDRSSFCNSLAKQYQRVDVGQIPHSFSRIFVRKNQWHEQGFVYGPRME